MATLNETSTPTRIRTKVAATLGIAAFTGAVFAAAQLLGPSKGQDASMPATP